MTYGDVLRVGGYTFECTCVACPEQYDVFDKGGNLVGYVKLRHSRLICLVIDEDGEPGKEALRLAMPWDDFPSRVDRMHYLKMCAKHLDYARNTCY
jgi:hypothetical protein